MKVLIIGSGLIGVTTACSLSRRGCEVTVIDRQEGSGQETSFANAALLTPSMSEPWNAPGCWRALLSSLSGFDGALQLRARALPALAGWGITFLRNSRAATFERNALSNLRLALYSLESMQAFREHSAVQYGRAIRGTLRVFRDPGALDRACAASDRMYYRLSPRRLSKEATIQLEPALEPIADQLVGAIHYEIDEIGDAHRFCTALTEHARQQGVEFRFRTEVSSLEMRSGWITAVLCGRQRLVADRYIVAAGSYSTPLLRSVGVHLPVQPVKGYSITFDDHGYQPLLRTPVVDDSLHAVVVPLQGAVRIAGVAEFAGFDLALSPRRMRILRRLFEELLPQAQLDPAAARLWCGLRPVSADGVPIIGPTSVANLLVNTGHGHLGWTMAAGSAQLLTDLLCASAPAIDPAPYMLARFADAP